MSEYNGTISTGGDFSVAASIAQMGLTVGPVIDTKGEIGIQYTFSVGFTLWSNACSATASRYLSMTNAPDIDTLNGDGESIGGSYSLPLGKILGVFGADINLIGEDADYLGITLLGGIGATTSPGGEIHLNMGYTRTLWSKNLFELWDGVYSLYKESRCESIE